jgi:sugar-specific transcriptional regulator TrmB
MEEISKTLTDLGLTAIQTKIILALNKFNYATVKDIAKAGEIHRQEIYPVLRELQSLGLVERKIGLPNEYKAVPLAQLLKILLERKTSWMSEVQKKTANLIQKNIEANLKENTKQEDYDFTLITGVERFSQALSYWAKNAQTIDDVLIFDRFSYQIGEQLKTANFKYKENVKIRIVTSADPESVNILDIKNRNVEVRFTSFETPVEIAIYNGNRAHLAIFSNRNNILKTEVAALTSNHPCYVKMLQNYFDILWNTQKLRNLKSAKKKRQKKKTVADADTTMTANPQI